MKLQQAPSRRIAIAALVLGLATAIAFPADVLAGTTVDVCGGGSGAAACNTFVENYINPVIILLTSLVGIAAVISIIMAGIQYSSSADDPGVVTKAKTRILNTVIGLVAYIFLLAFFNYLVPGGIF